MHTVCEELGLPVEMDKQCARMCLALGLTTMQIRLPKRKLDKFDILKVRKGASSTTIYVMHVKWCDFSEVCIAGKELLPILAELQYGAESGVTKVKISQSATDCID